MSADSDALLNALGHALVEHEEKFAAELDLALAALAEDFADTLDRRFAELPEARDGAPGQAGLDRVLMLPRHIGPAEPFERNDVARWRGGIWQAVRAGMGDPERDPAGWQCLVPGVAGIEVSEDWTRRELVFAFRMCDGHAHETRARMLPGLLPADYAERGYGVIAGDIIRDGDFERTALVDAPDPANPEHWQAREIRGRRGRAGQPGPAVAGLTLKREPGGPLSIVPSFAAPGIEATPIAVDVLLDEPGPGIRPLVGFAGGYSAKTAYGRGIAVRGPGASLWLSLRPDNTAPLDDGEAWERMI